MSWFPHFENWLPGVIAAGVVIPSLLVLYFLKLRRREMVISSTFLWKKAIQDLQVNAPFQKLRRNLLMLLQLLLLLALILALARPVSNYRPGAGKRTVILIDRSASMSAVDSKGHVRLDEAKRRAKELVDSMKRGSLFDSSSDSSAVVIAFDDTAQTIQPFTTDTAALRRAIDGITPTDRRTRVKLAFQLADGSANYPADQNRAVADPPDVHLFSDGRVLDDAPDLSVRGNLIYERVGEDSTRNIAVVSLSAKRVYEHPTEVQVFARLANFGPDPTDAQVRLSIDGQLAEVAGASRSTFLLPERWTREQRDQWDKDHPRQPAVDSVEFKLDLPTGAVLKVEQMNKDADALAADDAAQVVVPPPRSLSVLLVTDGNLFLEKAIASLGLDKPKTLAATAYEEARPTQYDVIIFDRCTPRFLPDAGNFVYILNGLHANLPDIGVKIVRDANRNPTVLADQFVLDWKRNHPVMKDLSLNKLYVSEAVKLQVPPEDEVLCDGLKCPLIVLDRTDRHANLVMAFDVLDSNFPFKTSFPMFFDNALHYLAFGSAMDVRQSFEPGATPVIPRSVLQQAGDPKTIRVKGPAMDAQVKVPNTGDVALPALNKVGLYTTEPALAGFEHIAVNLLDANESNLLPAPAAPGQSKTAIIDEKSSKARRELWWWFVAVGALPLLLVEWWVYTRRLHL